MKKLLCLGAFFLMTNTSGYAWQAYDGPETIKHNWSYAALAQTMTEIRQNCEPTQIDEFLEIGNWARGNNAKFSLLDLILKCEQIKPPQIIRTETKPCYFPSKTQCTHNQNGVPVSCGESVMTDNKWCDIFISTWVKYHNDIVNKIGTDKPNPGTYVEKKSVTMPNGQQRTAYKVIDVVLADEYYNNTQTKTINQTANQSKKNTKIYEIAADGRISEVPNCSTWTNDMFMDIQASSKNKAGDIRGAVYRSYIFCDEDVTQYIYEIYDKRRGMVGGSFKNAGDSVDGKDFDIKVRLGEKYKTIDQAAKTSHQNGLLFKGRVATIDFLGNMLYGMNREEAVLPNFVADTAADALSIVSAKRPHAIALQKHAEPYLKNRQLTAMLKDEQIVKEAEALLKENVIEPETVRNAWDMGGQFVKDAKFDYTFKNTQTKEPYQAYNKAKNRMISVYHAVEPVTCSGNCNPLPGNDDVVVCTDANGMRGEFIFDDICD